MIAEQIVKNSFIESLAAQLDAAAGTSTKVAVISANVSLDRTAVARLQNSGMLILRTVDEAISKTLEAGPLGQAIRWAVTEAGVSSLTLVGHSTAAKIEASEQTSNPVAGARLHNEQLAASKLKLKDDVARFVNDAQVGQLMSDDGLAVDALFYLHDNDTFLKYDRVTETFSAA